MHDPAMHDPAMHDPATYGADTYAPGSYDADTTLPGIRLPRTGRVAWPQRWPRLSPGHGTTITAMVTTVALLATGGLAAWQVGQMGSHPPATNTSLAMRGTRSGHAQNPAHAHSRAHTQTPARTTAPTSASPPAPAAARGTVTVTPAAAVQPHVRRVVTLLDTYFSAINQHDFQTYSSLFIPAIRATMHKFGPSYVSTRDSRARLTGLAATGPQGLAAMVTFVSHQNLADSPDHATCDRWHITLFLKHNDSGYHIRHPQPGFPADTVRACR